MAIRTMVRGRVLGLVAFGAALSSAGPLVLAAGSPSAPRVAPPDGNRVELGRRLFFDPAASRTGMRSCADCHDPQHGYADVEAVSRDARAPTPRHTQTLVDCVDSPSMDWSGALKKIEDVVSARTEPSPVRESPIPQYYAPPPVVTPGIQFVSAKMPDAKIPLPHEVLADSGRYHAAFEAAFADGTPTAERINVAISAYCRSIRSGMSAYDRYEAGETGALSASAKRGLALFRGQGSCTACHRMDGPRATFTDYQFHQTGITEPKTEALLDPEALAAAARAGALKGPAGAPLVALALAPSASINPKGFKTPTLRDVALRGPYMHNGSLKDLESVVRFFLSGATQGADPLMPVYQATDADVADLVAFLQALSSDVRPGTARASWPLRARRTRLRFVDADGKGLENWPVVLAPAGDALPGAAATTELIRLKTDHDGWVSYTPPPMTHVRIVLEGGLRPEGGCWIPDTCKESHVVIPLRGMGRLRVTFPEDSPVPEMLELEHDGADFHPDQRMPRTVLRLEGSAETHAGAAVAVYWGWIRTDVPAEATLLVPKNISEDGRSVRKVTLDPKATVAVHLE